MSYICKLCNKTFSEKRSQERHLNEKRCKSPLLDNWYKLHEYIDCLERKSRGETYNTHLIDENNRYININIEINPITKLDTSYILPTDMIKLVKKYDDNAEYLNLLLIDYINKVICNKEHPENHAVKYVKIKPPRYDCCIEDEYGNTISVINGLKDTCELLSDPILNTLRIKLREFITKYKPDDTTEFDYSLYEDAIQQLKVEFNKDTVKKALHSILKYNILDNIQMKLNIK